MSSSKAKPKRRNLSFRPTMSKSLTFVTGNANKLKEVQRILSTGSSSSAFVLNSRDLDLPEIQGSTQEVAKAKCRAAAEAIGGACMTEVRLRIDSRKREGIDRGILLQGYGALLQGFGWITWSIYQVLSQRARSRRYFFILDSVEISNLISGCRFEQYARWFP